MRFPRDRIVLISGAVVLAGVLIALIWSASAPDTPGTAGVSPDRDDIVAAEDDGDSGAGTVDLSDVDDLTEVVGQRVVVDRADVLGVPADEGFWIAGGRDRAWVQLTTAGESPFAVETGQRVSFVGEVAAHGPDFAERPEFSETDAEELVDAGAHLEVPVGDITITD